MTPREVLKFADQLRSQPRADEVRIRTAISRSYYAAYYHAVAWATARPPGNLPDNFKGGSHKELSTRLRNPSKSLDSAEQNNSIRLGEMLADLHSDRCDADYELDIPVTAVEASQAVMDATQIISIFN